MENNDFIPVYIEDYGKTGVGLYDNIPYVKATDIMIYLGYSKNKKVEDFFCNNYYEYYGSSNIGYDWNNSGTHSMYYEYDDYYLSEIAVRKLVKHIKKSKIKKKEILNVLGIV